MHVQRDQRIGSTGDGIYLLLDCVVWARCVVVDHVVRLNLKRNQYNIIMVMLSDCRTIDSSGLTLATKQYDIIS